ncbi:MAG: helicase-related protein [Proteobacteria bacterium]|nr:helicase-related protein [Pseudomonadota bacterium]
MSQTGTLKSTSQDVSSELAKNQKPSWSILLTHPEDLYPLVKLSGAHGLSHPLPKCRVNVIVFSDMKALRLYLKRQKIPSSEIFVWHEMDYWGDNRFSHPIVEMEDRMSALVAIAAGKPVTIATTCLSLLEKTIPSDEFGDKKMVISEGDELAGDKLCQQLKNRGYLPASSGDSYGTYARKHHCLELTPPGSSGSLRIQLSKENRVLGIETLGSSVVSGSGSLSSYTIFPASEVALSPEARDGSAQALYDNLIQCDTDARRRSMIMERFDRGEPFAGYYKMSPLLIKGAGQKDHTLLDHLIDQARGDFFVWDFMSQAQKNETIDQALSSAISSHEMDKKAGLPTLHPSHYYSDQQKVEDDIATFGYRGRLFSGTTDDTDSDCGAPSLITRDYLRSPLFHRGGKKSLLRHLNNIQHQSPSARNSSPEGEQTSLFFEQVIKQVMNQGGDRDQNDCDTPLVIVCENARVLAQWQELLAEQKDCIAILSSPWHVQKILGGEQTIFLTQGCLKRDYFLVNERIHYIPASWITSGAPPAIKKPDDKKWQNFLKSLSDISVGDLVVHRDHGVGRYLGFVDLGVSHGAAECLKVQYLGGDKIYVPVQHIHLLKKYSSSLPDESDGMSFEGSKPGGKLDSLGKGGSWNKRRTQVKKAVKDMAAEILRIHSEKKLSHYPPYGPPSSEFQKFVQDFSFVETEDQLQFCADMENDFQSGKSMDRLLIGDVGFGKTEMAMRAAVRTILEGYQVMVLCPTTILCLQHTATFRRRMSQLSIVVEGVNRFISSAKIKKISEDLAGGGVDVVVGTHRLLSKMFRPKKLGLVVIDEEQRFGVSHKEKLKSLRAEASVLALSATPIPRTMHMSMLGLRDISLLTVAPEGRLAVKNTVTTWDDQLIRQAILSEIRRGGQVFCVHNRIHDIEEFRRRLKVLLPDLDIRIAHGRMKESELEQVILEFSQNNFPILVCTSIMESGIDMPNVNTLIVNRSERYGLAQLYQFRGRVGRSGVQAYAYFITAPQAQMTDDAKKRMQVMMTYQALGSGFSIASYDMDLRGVGDILGAEQSGHVATVGLEMYTTMLDEALSKARGEKSRSSQDVEVQLNLASGFPSDYIGNDHARLQLYKKLFHLSEQESIDKFFDDLTEQYGALPKEVVALSHVASLKLSLKDLCVSSLKEGPAGLYTLKVVNPSDRVIDAVLQAIKTSPETYRFIDSEHVMINLSPYSAKQRLVLLPEKINYFFHGEL